MLEEVLHLNSWKICLFSVDVPNASQSTSPLFWCKLRLLILCWMPSDRCMYPSWHCRNQYWFPWWKYKSDAFNFKVFSIFIEQCNYIKVVFMPPTGKLLLSSCKWGAKVKHLNPWEIVILTIDFIMFNVFEFASLNEQQYRNNECGSSHFVTLKLLSSKMENYIFFILPSIGIPTFFIVWVNAMMIHCLMRPYFKLHYHCRSYQHYLKANVLLRYLFVTIIYPLVWVDLTYTKNVYNHRT